MLPGKAREENVDKVMGSFGCCLGEVAMKFSEWRFQRVGDNCAQPTVRQMSHSVFRSIAAVLSNARL